jgi:hypothetical protein
VDTLGFFLALPSIVAIAVHKLICAISGRDFEEEMLNIWIYRLIGVFVIWPGILLLLLLGSHGGVWANLAGSVAFCVAVLVVWGWFSSPGS